MDAMCIHATCLIDTVATCMQSLTSRMHTFRVRDDNYSQEEEDI